MNPFRKRFHSCLFAENNDGGNGGGGTESEKKTPDSEAGKEDKKEGNDIPYERFKEVNDRMKAAESKLQEIEEQKKKDEEAEAIKKGEQDKIIAQKNSEIEALKKEQEIRKSRESAVSERNTKRLADLEKKFGDKWGEVKNLVDDISDPFILSNKLDSLEKMSSESVKAPDGGSKIPGGSGQSRKEELMDKLKKEGRLTAKEKTELYELSEK